MKKSVFAILLLIGASASADTQLLHCNMVDGDLQSIEVIQNTIGQMELRMLTDSGYTIKRPLTNNEWQAKKIVLSFKGGNGLVSQKDGSWWYELKSIGMTVQGFCR